MLGALVTPLATIRQPGHTTQCRGNWSRLFHVLSRCAISARNQSTRSGAGHVAVHRSSLGSTSLGGGAQSSDAPSGEVDCKEHTSKLHWHGLQRQLDMSRARVRHQGIRCSSSLRCLRRRPILPFRARTALLLVPILGPSPIPLQQLLGLLQILGHIQI